MTLRWFCYCCCVYGFLFCNHFVAASTSQHVCVRASVSSTSVYILSTWFTFKQQHTVYIKLYIESIHCTLSIRHDEWIKANTVLGLAGVLVADSGWLMDITRFQLSEMLCVSSNLKCQLVALWLALACVCLCELNYLCALCLSCSCGWLVGSHWLIFIVSLASTLFLVSGWDAARGKEAETRNSFIKLCAWRRCREYNEEYCAISHYVEEEKDAKRKSRKIQINNNNKTTNN